MFRKLTVSLSIITSTYATAKSLTPKREWTQAQVDNHNEMLKKLVEGNGFEDVLGGFVNHEPYAKMLDVHNRREKLRARKLQEESEASNLRGNRKLDECDPAEVQLEDSPQWAAEKGYCEGELSLYDADGNANTSAKWPYQYDHYKGFITSSVNGNTYKQRNIFMYPALGHQPIPQELFDNVETTKAAVVTAYAKGSGKTRAEKRAARAAYREARRALRRETRRNLRRGQRACAALLAEDPEAITFHGENGECGVNGNTKLFEAEQAPQHCSNNPELAGDIEGPYGNLSYTYTQLIGQDNALLYQVYLTASALNYYQGAILGNPGGLCTQINPYVWDCGYTEDRLMQSQLTTLTEVANFDGSTTQRRTRTAQGFDAFTPGKVGTPSYASFYREVKVAPEEASAAAQGEDEPEAPAAERRLDHIPGHIGGTFYTAMENVEHAYNIEEEDMGAYKSSDTGSTVDTGLEGDGIERVFNFLEEAFVHDAAPEV